MKFEVESMISEKVLNVVETGGAGDVREMLKKLQNAKYLKLKKPPIVRRLVLCKNIAAVAQWTSIIFLVICV